MSTATVTHNSQFDALMGTYGSTSLSPSASLLGFMASEIAKLWRKPAAKGSLNAAEQAEALRRYADDIDDPRFADELYAAAARHEGLV